MKTILLTNSYSGLPLEIVRNNVPEGFEILFPEAQTQDALLAAAPRAHYILAGGRLKITDEVLARASGLKMVQRSGVGLDALDLDALRARNIPLYVNRGINAQSVAEHTLLLMLACLRRLTVLDRNTKAGIWKKQEQGVRTRELHGKTVGIIGMGSIARTLVTHLMPFGVKIVYSDIIRAQAEFENKYSLTFLPVREVLAAADIVTLHCALTPDTANLINAETLAAMKPESILINTARGALVDACALYDALKEGRLSFAALDVHAEEPPSQDYPLKTLENVILTPHIAGVTYDSFAAMMRDAFGNIAAFERGETEKIAPSRYL
ncbi:MAG: 2-hydroxyacid dehydrogenase [Clostridia bacterium]|nr:2-hydroxyacid dehydrogenase [Clostridia bacterium]